MTIVKHLPWIAPTVAILAVGVGLSGRINTLMDGNADVVAQTAPVAPTVVEPDPAVAALAAVTAVTEPVAAPANVADQIAALLVEEPVVEDVDVTRNQGLSISAVEEVAEVAAVIQEEVTPSQTGQVGADFFSAAQANLAQANSCANDLRNLASQSQVYFPRCGSCHRTGCCRGNRHLENGCRWNGQCVPVRRARG